MNQNVGVSSDVTFMFISSAAITMFLVKKQDNQEKLVAN